MTHERLAAGHRGEAAAALHLEGQGFAIVARNFRTREGELDLIAADQCTLVFCEVKTLVTRQRRNGPVHPFESIHAGKRARVRRMASAWLASAPRARSYEQLRFDAIGVWLSPAGEVVELTHLPNAF